MSKKYHITFRIKSFDYLINNLEKFDMFLYLYFLP